MTIYGYTRVSTSDQAENGQSLDAQRSMIAGYCMMKGWTDQPLFLVERGVSGSKPLMERPEGKELFIDGLLKPGDAVVVTKLDRMFRNAADALVSLEHFKALGVSVHMLDLGGDVTGNGISKLVFTILAAVAEAERDRIRERIRDTKRHLIAQGKYPGGRRPYGYDVVKGEYIPREDEQEVIRRIVALNKDGWGATRIATYITRTGRACFFPTQVQRIIDREESLCAT